MPQNNLWPTAEEILRFLPEMILTLAAVFVMALHPVTQPSQKRGLSLFSVAALLVAAAVLIWNFGQEGASYNGMLLQDGYSTFFRLLVIFAGALVAIISMGYLKTAGHESGEFFALLLFSVVGQCIMVSANELIMIFIGIEISSISSYVMAGFLRDDKRNNEAALKYFLLGSFATAFLLYGIAWVYGLCGTTNLTGIRNLLSTRPEAIDPVIISVAVGLIFVGLAFKLSAAPFQMWAPDVYQGAPAPVSAFFSAGPKAAAFAVLLRTFLGGFSSLSSHWQIVVSVSALATMLIGNFSALRQHNIKRMLAYSSVAHAGYIMVAVAAQSDIGVHAVMFYLATYAFMNIGAFAIVTHVARKDERYTNIEDFAGLAQHQPLTAATLTLFLLSLIGVPLTGGFFGKFYIFQAALSSDLVWLTVLGLLSSSVAAYYYLRVIGVMYMKEPSHSLTTLERPSAGTNIAMLTSAAVTLLLGLYPSSLLQLLDRAGRLLR